MLPCLFCMWVVMPTVRVLLCLSIYMQICEGDRFVLSACGGWSDMWEDRRKRVCEWALGRRDECRAQTWALSPDRARPQGKPSLARC